MQKIAIIPARGGSKRIPGKNIRPFHGKPIIAYSIEAAIRSDLFDEIMVSTDDEEIAAISRKLGAGVPFMRSKKTSDEKTGIADVMAEVITDYESLGRSFDVFCCILATAPFVSAEHLREGYRLLESEKFDSVLSATQYGHPIERALQIEGKKAVMKWPENYSRRSQDIPPSCHDAGQFYWMRTDALLRESRLFTDSTGAIILPATEVQDIDDDDDWKLAELKFEIIRKS